MTQEKEQLCTQLSDALMYLLVPEQYDEQLDKLREKEKDFHKIYFQKKNATTGVKIGIWVSGIVGLTSCHFLFVSLVFALLISIFLAIILSAICFIAAFVAIGVFVFCIIDLKQHSGDAKKYWDEVASPAIIKIRQQIGEIETERDRFLNEYAYVLDFLPEDYREVMAVGYMEECIRNLRADTLKEAINLYEEQKHRWTMESLAQQMLAETELHNQIMQTGFQAIYDEQRRTTAMVTNIRNLTLFNTMRDIHKEIKNS